MENLAWMASMAAEKALARDCVRPSSGQLNDSLIGVRLWKVLSIFPSSVSSKTVVLWSKGRSAAAIS
jgi:hypothetical protein